MEYIIHGRTIQYEGGACGLYKSDRTGFIVGYAELDVSRLVEMLNGLDVRGAEAGLTKLRDLVQSQLSRAQTPSHPFSPLLVGGPAVTPFFEVKQNLENTVRFVSSVLQAL